MPSYDVRGKMARQVAMAGMIDISLGTIHQPMMCQLTSRTCLD